MTNTNVLADSSWHLLWSVFVFPPFFYSFPYFSHLLTFYLMLETNLVEIMLICPHFSDQFLVFPSSRFTFCSDFDFETTKCFLDMNIHFDGEEEIRKVFRMKNRFWRILRNVRIIKSRGNKDKLIKILWWVVNRNWRVI